MSYILALDQGTTRLHLGVLDVVPLRLEPRLLASVMVEARFAPGTHEVYQVPVAARVRKFATGASRDVRTASPSPSMDRLHLHTQRAAHAFGDL